MDKHDGKNLGSATWLQFFKEAGLPTKACASYAVIFTENRISKDMLSELTVDYLRLMGVTLMGDIIAILRHCKSVHQDSLRKVVILKSKETSSKRSSSSSSSSSGSSSDDSSSSDDVEMVDVSKSVTRKPVANSSIKKKEYETTKKPSPPILDVKPIKSKVIGKISSSTIVSNKTVVPSTKTKVVALSKTVEQPVKRKYFEESEILPIVDPATEVKSSFTSTGKSILKTPVLPAKKIRVIAENDLMGPKLPPPKKTVFERLGAENDSPQVSSTTEIAKPEAVTTKFTRTIKNVTLPVKTSSVDDDDESPRLKMSSVFDRLGGLKDDFLKREVKGPTLQYAGVFKSPPNKNTSRPVLNILKKVGTMRADEPEIPVKLRASRSKLAYVNDRPVKVRIGEFSVKSRLKPSSRLNKTVSIRTKEKEPSAGIFANPYKKTSLTSKLTIKERLGLQNGPAENTLTTIKRLRRNFPAPVKARSNYTDEEDKVDNYIFPSRVEFMESKKVSFGRVEQKIITPARQLKNSKLQSDSMKTRAGVHSRLGTPNWL